MNCSIFGCKFQKYWKVTSLKYERNYTAEHQPEHGVEILIISKNKDHFTFSRVAILSPSLSNSVPFVEVLCS